MGAALESDSLEQGSDDANGAVAKMAMPKLEKPGAGLPFIEWAVAKYITFPKRFKNSSKEKALSDFAKQSDKILKLAKG